MKPVAICRFAPHEGPGYFATYLDAHRVPWSLVKVDRGETLPSVNDITGLALMGGPMSVNDPLAWIAPMLALVRESIAQDVPVIGHCLGGQLLAKALGARVTRNPVKEIGWGEIRIEHAEFARRWGPDAAFIAYHWHGETFSIPDRAVRIWSSAHCENQAFVIGNNLGMQCHVEMTEELIESWCLTGAAEIDESHVVSPAVQTPDAMREHLSSRLTALAAVADRVYGRWTVGLRR